MYVNAAVMGLFARVGPPERAHSGGPLSQLMDVWRAGGRRSIYSRPTFTATTTFCVDHASYVRNGNPLFIPESNGGKEGATRALYASDATTPWASRLSVSMVQSARHRPGSPLRPH